LRYWTKFVAKKLLPTSLRLMTRLIYLAMNMARDQRLRAVLGRLKALLARRIVSRRLEDRRVLMAAVSLEVTESRTAG
jgi:hypothetical protein